MIHIVYSTDDNYVFLMATSIKSIIDNNLSDNRITFHVLSNNISEKSKMFLKVLILDLKYELIYYDISNISQKLGKIQTGGISETSYARLFISQLLPNSIEKVIYLDCDTIVLNDINNFWSLNDKRKTFYGVKDLVPNHFLSGINIPVDSIYVNAGVLLINLELFRKNKYDLKIEEFLNNYTKLVPHHDQGIINKLFHEDIGLIQPKFNFMTPFFLLNTKNLSQIYNIEHFYTDEEILESKNEIVVAHLTQSFLTRPWIKNSTHPLAKVFLETLKSTPFKNIELKSDTRIWKVKIVSVLYKMLPNVIFVKLVKLLN